MRKQRMAVAVIVILIAGGFFMYRHFISSQITDGPVMENPAGPVLELLNAEWLSEDGVWSAHIDDYTLDLSYRQELVYSGTFSFDFPSGGNGLSGKNVLSLKDKQFESGDGNISGTIERVYVKKRRLYLDIIVSKEGKDGVRQQVVLNREDSGGSAEGGAEEIREPSEMAELVEFSWHQGAMSFDDCFDFWIRTTEGESAAPCLYCDYTDPETGERIKLGEEDIGFQEYGIDGMKPAEDETRPTVPLDRWTELAGFLRKAEFAAYTPPPPELLDAAESRIQITWRENGETFTNSCSGFGAHNLLELLQDIAGKVSRRAEEEPKSE